MVYFLIQTYCLIQTHRDACTYVCVCVCVYLFKSRTMSVPFTGYPSRGFENCFSLLLLLSQGLCFSVFSSGCLCCCLLVSPFCCHPVECVSLHPCFSPWLVVAWLALGLPHPQSLLPLRKVGGLPHSWPCSLARSPRPVLSVLLWLLFILLVPA